MKRRLYLLPKPLSADRHIEVAFVIVKEVSEVFNQWQSMYVASLP